MLELARKHMARMEAVLLKLEASLSLWGVACLVATALMALGALYVRPAVEPVSHGVYYAELSQAPFAPGENPEAYRILTPLLAYLLGLRGNGILVVNLAFAWLMLALVYGHYRQKGCAPALALGYAAILATSMPVLFTIHVNGYTDAASHVLLFVLMVYGKNAVVFGISLFLALLNRESILFMLPFLWLAQKQRDAALGRLALATAAAIGAYALVRYLLSLNAQAQQSAAYYLGPLLRDPFHWLRKASVAYYQGVFSAFKLFWLVPIAAIWQCVRQRRWREAVLIASAIVCALAQTVIAIDTSRMACLAFPAILLGLEILEERLARQRLEPVLLALVGINLLVPQIYVAGNAVYIMQTLLGYLLTH